METDPVVLAYCAGPCAETRNAVLIKYLPLCRKLARRYGRFSAVVGHDDLVHDALTALARCMSRFDPARGRLLTYAYPAIRQAVRRASAAGRSLGSAHAGAIERRRAAPMTRHGLDDERLPPSTEIANGLWSSEAQEALARLQPRDRLIARLRADGLSQEAVGKIVGRTKSLISLRERELGFSFPHAKKNPEIFHST